MNDFALAFEEALARFPTEAQKHLRTIPENAGILERLPVQRLLVLLETSIERLMVQLLPLAAAYAIVPISNFRVGAIVRGITKDAEPRLYLGANIEFPGEALSLSIHAEQAATVNAWNHGEPGLFALATSAAPCGYCRQFLFELTTAKELMVLLPSEREEGYLEKPLTHLLPQAFGPWNLGVKSGFMDPGSNRSSLAVTEGSADQLAQEALEAAMNSYAPYTGGYAGCALQIEDGRIFRGRYAENAAHNPSISPLQAAITVVKMSLGEMEPRQIKRATLVELSARTSQRSISKHILKSIAPDVELEFYQAIVVDRLD